MSGSSCFYVLSVNPDGTDVITDHSQSVMAGCGSGYQHYEGTKESHTGQLLKLFSKY